MPTSMIHTSPLLLLLTAWAVALMLDAPPPPSPPSPLPSQAIHLPYVAPSTVARKKEAQRIQQENTFQEQRMRLVRSLYVATRQRRRGAADKPVSPPLRAPPCGSVWSANGQALHGGSVTGSMCTQSLVLSTRPAELGRRSRRSRCRVEGDMASVALQQWGWPETILASALLSGCGGSANQHGRPVDVGLVLFRQVRTALHGALLVAQLSRTSTSAGLPNGAHLVAQLPKTSTFGRFS